MRSTRWQRRRRWCNLRSDTDAAEVCLVGFLASCVTWAAIENKHGTCLNGNADHARQVRLPKHGTDARESGQGELLHRSRWHRKLD
jgi:hypothetical protein